MDDVKYMLLAIEQARRSSDGTPEAPSPRVGAIVVRETEILAYAYRGESAPGDHAEFVALERKLRDQDLSGATVYTTLEPCTDRAPGKTPCAFRLISRRVQRVVIGVLDPNPTILGRGWLALQDAGISVTLLGNELGPTIREMSARFEAHQRAKQRSTTQAAALAVPKRRATAPIVEMALTEATGHHLNMAALEEAVLAALGGAASMVDGSKALDETLAVTGGVESPPMATRYALGASIWCAIRIETAGAQEVPATLLAGLQVDLAGRLPSMREVVSRVPSFLLNVATNYATRMGVRVSDTVTVHLDGLPVLALRPAAEGGWLVVTEVER